MPSIDIMIIGFLLLGSAIGLFNKPWWSVLLCVSGAVVLLSIEQVLSGRSAISAAIVFSPESLFIGIGFFSLSALAGWGIGKLLHMLGGRPRPRSRL